ncbi:cell division protein ZapA [Thiolinea disciformis]|uniref:cell division protein ZapA n=1 Tax=Thiolinea disciformis TaxID=125614 RepID=UPI00036BCE8C|nr:cell division protein ZapA [Thiolinea disciformis]
MDQQIVPVKVLILSKEYTVACPKGQEKALLASAQRVDEEMRRIRDTGKVLGNDRIAVMVALNLANELLLKTQSSALPTPSPINETDPQTLERLQGIQAKLDSALKRFTAVNT